MAHLLRVTGIVLEHGGNEDEAIAALLHDAVEDGGLPVLDEIRRRFGPFVANRSGVLRLDGPAQAAVAGPKQSHVAHVRAASPSVRLVVAADKLDNARSLLAEYRVRGESLWSFFHGGRDGTLWYYNAMLAALQEAGPTALVEELELAIGELHRITGEGRTDSRI